MPQPGPEIRRQAPQGTRKAAQAGHHRHRSAPDYHCKRNPQIRPPMAPSGLCINTVARKYIDFLSATAAERRAGAIISGLSPTAPLGHDLRVNPVSLRKCSQAFLAMQHRSADCHCRADALLSYCPFVHPSFLRRCMIHHQTLGPNNATKQYPRR